MLWTVRGNFHPHLFQTHDEAIQLLRCWSFVGQEGVDLREGEVALFFASRDEFIQLFVESMQDSIPSLERRRMTHAFQLGLLESAEGVQSVAIGIALCRR